MTTTSVLLIFIGVLHTIIFNRALGYVTPKDVDSELFDISYVGKALAAVQPKS